MMSSLQSKVKVNYLRFCIWDGQRRRGNPDLYDKFGYPYWIDKTFADDEDLSAGSSTWVVVNHKRGYMHHAPFVAQIKFYWNESAFNLADMIFKEPYRARGLGAQLLNRLSDIARKHDLPCIAWSVASEGYFTQEELENWYRRYGFGPRREMPSW